METQALVEQIKQQFILETPGGLIFELGDEELNTYFYFEHNKTEDYRHLDQMIKSGMAYKIPTSKEKVFKDLIAYSADIIRDSRFPNWSQSEYKQYWKFVLDDYEEIKKTLENINKYYDSDLVKKDDIVITNVYRRTYAKVFIINSKFIVEIEFSPKGLESRQKQLIKRDIKSVVANEKEVCVYFHGISAAFKIGRPTYKEVVKLQDLIVNFRA